MDVNKNEIDLELSEDIINDKDKREVIEKTYKSYSDKNINFSVNRSKLKNEIDKNVNKQLDNKNKNPENITSKKITFNVNSMENLTPELQESIRSLLDNRNSKNEISRLVKEIELEKNNFLKKQDGLFGKMNEKDMETLEKKLNETNVSQEVTEINLSAIVSCLNNIMSK